MTRAALLLFFLVAACSGETKSDGGNAGSTASGGSGVGASGGSGGSSSGGTSSGGTSSGGTPGGGGSAGSGALGGGGAPSGGGSAGTGAGGATDGGACQEGGVPDAGVEATIHSSCVIAVVKVTRIDEECSGAGGAHITLDVIAIGKGSGVTKVNHGGHAYYPPPEGPDQVGDYFVAGIDPYGKLIDQPDNPGWCIVGLPQVDGWAHTFLAASSEADAKTKMAAILAL